MHYGNFEKHLHRLQATVYPENEIKYHTAITKAAIKSLVTPLAGKISDVLDVGCGQGPALAEFLEIGLKAVGISLDDGDLKICREKGFSVSKQDMSFLEFPDNSFDLIWARHCMEHSPMPMVTLLEFERVARKGAYLYIEVPPDNSPHVENKNHYSMLSDEIGRASWGARV